MRRNNQENLNSSQKTVWYYPDAPNTAESRIRERDRYFEGLHSHMLIEDVMSQIVPYTFLSSGSLFRIDLLPASKAAESLVIRALKTRENERHYELRSSVCDFIRECVQSIMIAGEAVYEIV